MGSQCKQIAHTVVTKGWLRPELECDLKSKLMRALLTELQTEEKLTEQLELNKWFFNEYNFSNLLDTIMRYDLEKFKNWFQQKGISFENINSEIQDFSDDETEYRDFFSRFKQEFVLIYLTVMTTDKNGQAFRNYGMHGQQTPILDIERI